MGIETIETLESSYERLIDEYIKVSPNISDYYSNEEYLDSVREEDTQADNQFIFNCLTTLMINELIDMGIDVSDNLDIICQDTYTVTLILKLRKLFDVKLFSQTYIKFDDETKSVISSMLENSTDEDLLLDLIVFFYEKFPMNDDLEFLIRYSDYFVSTSQFKCYLNELIELIDENVDDDEMFSDESLSVIDSYIQYTSKHRMLVQHAFDCITNAISNLNNKQLKNKIEEYDLDLMAIDNLNVLSAYYNSDNILDYENCDIIKKHKETYEHHLEYYLKNKSVPNDEQLVLLVCEIYARTYGTDKLLKQLANVSIAMGFPSNISNQMIKYASTILSPHEGDK